MKSPFFIGVEYFAHRGEKCEQFVTNTMDFLSLLLRYKQDDNARYLAKIDPKGYAVASQKTFLRNSVWRQA